MKHILASIASLVTLWIIRLVKGGAGATWPGEIALRIDPKFVSHCGKRITKGIILVAGTNGKTTTVKMITKILKDQHYSVLTNESGANLVNGVASSFVSASIFPKKFDYAVFEVDENALSQLLEYLTPNTIILLNLFRDQLDRYGEVDSIMRRWIESFLTNARSTKFLINADDPGTAYIGRKIMGNIRYFGLEDPSLYIEKMEFATDSTFCPNCGTKLTYGGSYFSHLGKWACGTCDFRHPEVAITSQDVTSPLPGVYNIYNTLAAWLCGRTLGIDDEKINSSLSAMIAAFGRYEAISYKTCQFRIILSKNPTGMNESIRTVLSLHTSSPIIFALNDRIPDGRDVSWIWDVDFETLDVGVNRIIATGDRTYDLATRLSYALGKSTQAKDRLLITPSYQEAIDTACSLTKPGDTCFILATYSAMLDIRKILTGKKIL